MAAIKAGVDFIATDQYEDLAALVKAQGGAEPPIMQLREIARSKKPLRSGRIGVKLPQSSSTARVELFKKGRETYACASPFRIVSICLFSLLLQPQRLGPEGCGKHCWHDQRCFRRHGAASKGHRHRSG